MSLRQSVSRFRNLFRKNDEMKMIAPELFRGYSFMETTFEVLKTGLNRIITVLKGDTMSEEET